MKRVKFDGGLGRENGECYGMLFFVDTSKEC